MKRVLFAIMLAVITFSAMSFEGNAKPNVPTVTVQQNVPGAPGSTGSYACFGTFVTVTEVNECGQTVVLQQYWVASSIHCIPVE